MSKEELTLVKRLRKLVKLVSAYSVFLGIFMIYLAVTPAYVVDGVIKGYVALTHSEIFFYGTPVRLDTLSSASLFFIPVLILSTYLILAGIATLYLFFRGKDVSIGIKWLFGGALSTLTSSGLVYAVINKVIMITAASLNLSLDHVTSAGTLYLGSSRVSPAYPTGYLISPPVIFLVTLTYVILAVVTYLHMALIEELKLGRHSLYREIKYRVVGS